MYYHDSKPHSPVYFTGADYCPTSMQLHESWSCQVYPDGTIAHDGMCLNLKTSEGTGVQCANYFCNPILKKLQMHHFQFDDGEDTVTCDFDFQLHDHPWFDDVQMECPKLSTMCPQFFSCPAICSANGVCDYSSESPVCICFDENDISESCDGSVMRETSMDATEEEVVVLDVVEANKEVASEELMEEEELVEEITVEEEEEEVTAEESIEEEEEEEVSDCIPSVFLPCP